MAKSASTSQSHSPCPSHQLRLNASRGPRPAIEYRQTDRPRRKWLATQDQAIQKGKELRYQNWAKRCRRLDELSVLNTELSKALDMKECMLEVQGILLGKLAVEENRLNRPSETLGRSIADFDERVREVEEAI